MVWNSIKMAAIPVVVAASVLGTAVVAQQGRDAGQAQGGSVQQVAPSNRLLRPKALIRFRLQIRSNLGS